MPVIASVGTAVPPHRVIQQDSQEFAQAFFKGHFKDIERLLGVFAAAEIESRHFCVPREWFGEYHSWEEKSALYLENAIALGATAIKKCLEKSGLNPGDIDILLFISSTGIATPSIDAYLFNLLKMSPGLVRLPLWGLGCAGGVAGIARSLELARARPDSRILACCVELCGLAFMYNDRSKSNLIATSLFADGAAAVLTYGDEAAAKAGLKGPKILGSQSTLFPDTLDVMGWDVRNDGLMVVFSKDIPQIVAEKVRPRVLSFLEENDLSLSGISRVTAHPGGVKVLKAYEKSLSLPHEVFEHAYHILRHYGNMSSCTVLFVLERELSQDHREGEYGLMLSLGPGFSCEQVLLQW